MVFGCVFYNFTGDAVAWYGPYGLTVLNCTFHAITGNAINAGAMTDLSSLVVEGCIFAGISGEAIYSTASPTRVVPGRVAHNIAYNVNGVQTPASFASICSSNVLDNSQDMAFANPFSSGETLAAAAVQHPILLADGSTTTYPTLGAVQARITLPVASHVLNDQPAYGINGNLSSGSLTLPAGSYVSTAAGTYGVAGTGSTPTLDMSLYTLTSTINWPTASGVLIGTYFGITGSLTQGTFDEATRNIDPGIANVLSGTHYTIHGSALIGSYASTIVVDMTVEDVALEVV